MLRRRKEGSGQIITKPTEERESAEISFGGQVSEDERRSTLRMATICLIGKTTFSSAAMPWSAASMQKTP